MNIRTCTLDDLPHILALQRLCYQENVGRHNRPDIQPMTQTLAEVETEFRRGVVLVADMDGALVGSVRGYLDNGICYIGKLIVHPDHQNRGIGTRLMSAIEAHYTAAARYELFTAEKDAKNLHLYHKLGYRPFRNDDHGGIAFVYLEKLRDRRQSCTMIPTRNILIQIELSRLPELLPLLESADFGYEIGDFYAPAVLRDESAYARGIEEYRALAVRLGPRVTTMHGAFFDLAIHGFDHDVVALTHRRIARSLQTAVDLQCSKVVFHTGISPQGMGDAVGATVDRHATFWAEMLAAFPNIEICVENVWEYDPVFFTMLFAKVNHLRMCLDNGHVRAFSKTEFGEWLKHLGPRLSHVHLSDNDLLLDRHFALGQGRIDILGDIRALSEVSPDLTYKLEVRSSARTVQSLAFLREHGVIAAA